MIELVAAASMLTPSSAPAARRAQFNDTRWNAVVRELVDGYQPGRERRDGGEAFVRMDDRDARQIDTNALLQRMLTDRGLAQRVLFYPGENDPRRNNPFVAQSLDGTTNEIRIRPEREQNDPRQQNDRDEERESERTSIGRLATLTPRGDARDRIVIAALGPAPTASSLGQFGTGRVTSLQRGMARMEAGSDVAARWTTPVDTLASRRTPGLGGLSDMSMRRLESMRGDSIMSAERDLSRFQSPAMGSMRRGLSDMRRSDYSGQNFGRGFSSAPSGSLSRFSNGLR